MKGPVFAFVAISTLFARFERNFRRRDNYKVDPKSSLYVTMKEEGFRDDKPLVVSKQADGRLLVLQGHRRFSVATELHKLEPERFAKIPVLIYEEMTPSEEIEKMADQGHILTLDGFEQFLAIQALLQSGKSEAEIIRITGLSRGYVQRRCWVARMPKMVQEEWEKKVREVDGALNLTDPNLAILAKAMEADKKNGFRGKSGPEFESAWAKLVETGRADGSAAPPRAKTISVMESTAAAIQDDILSKAIYWCAGHQGIDTGQLADAMRVLRFKASKWDEHEAQAAEAAKAEKKKKA